MSTPIDYADKIDKLLRKAAGNDSESEAEALREKAYALMATYSIDDAEIAARRRKAGEQVNEPIIEKEIRITGIFRYGLNQLTFDVVAALENLGVRAYYSDKQLAVVGKTAKGAPKFAEAIRVTIVGRASDVDQAILMITSLQLQAAAAMTTWWKTNPSREWMNRGLAFRSRRSFIMAFGLGAAQKIRLSQRRARATVATGSGAELVLRDKSAEVDAFMEAKKLRNVTDRFKAGVYDAQDSGYAAGQRANTGDTAVGKTERRAIT